ncbi:MAG: SLC5/6 family protein, partial [Planctomycetota bacterium]
LTSLSASSTNEFCEVILGGMIVVPAAFLFLGAENAKGTTFGLGFVTIPAIMHFMPGGPFWGSFFGAMWFGLLFLAAVTSSLSMLQPAIAFLEDGFGLRRRGSVTILGVITIIGVVPIMYYSKNALALDYTDFWCNVCMILAATGTVIVFGWVVGAERGVKEMNRGADFAVPRFMPFVVRYITPTFLVVILIAWTATNAGDYIAGMDPAKRSLKYEREVYVTAIAEHHQDDKLSKEQLETKTEEYLGPDGTALAVGSLPEWLQASQDAAEEARAGGPADANVARFVFIAIVVFLILLTALGDIACRNRVGREIARAEAQGGGIAEVGL